MTQATNDIVAGAFELQGLSGVSLARGGEALGIRLACPHVSLGMFDGTDVTYSLDAPCVHSPDSGYARTSWLVPIAAAAVRRYASLPRWGINTPRVDEYAPGEAARVALEWAFDGELLQGRYTADAPLRVALFAHGSFAPATAVQARADHCRVIMDAQALELGLCGELESSQLVDDGAEAERVWFGTAAAAGSRQAMYAVALGPDAPLHFTMRLAARAEVEDDPPLRYVPDPQAIDLRLAAGNERYETERMRSAGYVVGGAAEAVGSLTGYSRTYDPHRRRLQTTVNRTWGGPHQPGLIFGWDNFFDSYIAAWEDPALGASSLEHIVSIYGENGIAHGPVQRNLIIPILYCRTLDLLGDSGVTERTWPTMMAFMRFWFGDRGDGRPWRDGNDDGLIECGASEDPATTALGHLITAAMDETGYDESPIYSAGFADGRRALLADNVDFDMESRCLTITVVGQNSLYVASCRAMARQAERLGRDDERDWLLAEAERVGRRMIERLLCPVDGIFRNRYWNGDFSPVKAMTTFFPLLAGVADDECRERLRTRLLDPEQFWGDNLMPTVSRDDPAYCDGLDGTGNYWRGNCWGPTTYVTYLAIKEAGWDDVAAAYAERTCRQFMTYWDRHTHCYENFPAAGEVDHRFLYVQPWGGRELRYVWGAMNLFCGLEEVFGFEVLRAGLRFGNPHLPEETSWSGFRYRGKRVEATSGPRRTHVRVADDWEFLAEPGVVVREFTLADGRAGFSVTASRSTRITLTAAGLGPEVVVDGQAAAARADGDAVSLTIEPGTSEVRIG